MAFEVLRRLGQGAFGDVALGRRTSAPHELVAIKVIDLEAASSPIEDIQKEIQVLAELSSPQVVQYKGAYMAGNNLHIVMELLDAGTLLDLLSDEETGGPLPESLVAVCAREVLTGLAYLHANNMIHRDIKADNILLSMDGSVKIGDFGETGRLTNTMDKRNTVVGSPYWMAPEVITESNYDFSADIWSLGITAMELTMGEPPLMHIHPMRVLFLIPKNPPPTLEVDGASRQAKEFVAACLKKEPSERQSASQLLKHKFIRGSKKGLEGMAALIRERRGGKKKLAVEGGGSNSGGESKANDGGGTIMLAEGAGGGGADAFDEDSDQGDGEVSDASQDSGSDSDDSDDSGSDSEDDDDDGDWDFESRKFSPEELKQALAEQNSLDGQLSAAKPGAIEDEIGQVDAGLDAVLAGASAAKSAEPADIPIAPDTLLPAGILPLPSLMPKSEFLESAAASSSLLPLPSLMPREEFLESSSESSGSAAPNGDDAEPVVNIFDSVVQPAMDGLLGQMSPSNLYFGDTTAALAQLRLAFNQLDACSPTRGTMTAELMARVFCEASRSPFSSVRELYENPTVDAGGDSRRRIGENDVSSDAAAADLVSKALLERLEAKSDTYVKDN